MWSMARDRAFPFSSYFASVSKTLQMPLRAMWAIIVVNALCGLLVLGSDLAFYAIISGGGVTLQVFCCIPILCVVLRGRSVVLPSRQHFDLGRWGYAVNIASLLWSIVVVLFYVFPQYVPVAGAIENMNWAILIVAAIVVFGGGYWICKGHKEYMMRGNSVMEDSVVVIEGKTDAPMFRDGNIDGSELGRDGEKD